MKTLFRFIGVCFFILTLIACESFKTAEPVYSADSINIDAAISNAADHFIQRLSSQAKVALVHFDTPTGRLSDYIFEELWNHFEDSGKFVMVDRRNLVQIETEINHQYGSGRVDDNLLVSMSRQYGAEILVYGQMTALGSEYRITVYAIDVERAVSNQRVFNVRPDNRLISLLNASAEEEVERAVASMARNVSLRTVIAIGRISYGDTQAVSSLSAWLKNSIITSANKHDNLQVASENESSEFAVASRGLTVVPSASSASGSTIQAVVIGSFSHLDSDAVVSLQLISTTGNREVLSSTRFIFPASELQRRRLSILPENNYAAITRVDFLERQQAADSYSGRNNRWNFTVTPDVLDGIYYDGDYMTMRIFSERDSYFRIIHVDVNGNTQVIYPVSAGDNNFIRAGETRRIPDSTRFRLHAPFGEEMILVSAYDRPFIGGQVSYRLSQESVTRGLSVEDNNHTAMSPSATARFSYTILPR